MRSIAAILLSLTYLVTTSGFIVGVHYCQGEVESVTIGAEAGHCCCQDFDMDACCDDEIVQVKVDTDHTIAKTLSWQAADQVVAAPQAAPLMSDPIIMSRNALQMAEPPPDFIPSFLVYCALRC